MDGRGGSAASVSVRSSSLPELSTFFRENLSESWYQSGMLTVVAKLLETKGSPCAIPCPRAPPPLFLKSRNFPEVLENDVLRSRCLGPEALLVLACAQVEAGPSTDSNCEAKPRYLVVRLPADVGNSTG